MYLTKKHVSRRTVLRGMGATIALPFLEAMVPARTALANTAAAGRTRLACIEQVHGAAGSTQIGLAKNLWSPAAVGRTFECGDAQSKRDHTEPHRPFYASRQRTQADAGRRATPNDPASLSRYSDNRLRA